jgi:hypothetical protein
MALRLAAPARLAAVALSGFLACAGDAAPPADLVVYGRVWTGDSARPWAGGVAVVGDTIVAVGDSGEIARRVGEGTRVIANAGGMVTPGFMDGHLHLVDGGFPTRERGPPPGRLAGGVHRPAGGVRGGKAAGGVDHRGRLGPRALARRAAAAPRVDRLGHAQQPGVRQPA